MHPVDVGGQRLLVHEVLVAPGARVSLVRLLTERALTILRNGLGVHLLDMLLPIFGQSICLITPLDLADKLPASYLLG